MNNHRFAQMCLLIGTVSKVSVVAHGSLVSLKVIINTCYTNVFSHLSTQVTKIFLMNKSN